MALSGTLDTFALPDVLRLLGSTQKSGRLRVTGDRGSGSVWVDDGEVVATELSSLNSLEPTDIEVVFGLLRFDAGSFTFETDAASPNAGESMAMDPILRASENMLTEWRSIEEVVPSLAVWVGLAPELDGPDVMIDAIRWRCIAAIRDGSQVGAVAEALHLNEIESCRIVKELIELGLVEITEEPVQLAMPRPAEFVVEPVADNDYDDHLAQDDEASFDERRVDGGDVDEEAGGDDNVADGGEVDPHTVPSFIDESLANDTFGDAFAGADDSDAGHDNPSTVPSLASLASSDEPSIDPLLSSGDPLEAMAEVTAPGGGLFSVSDGSSDDGDLNPAEMARQLANLSPKAAKAVAAAAKASTDAERDAALAAVEAEDDSVNRGLLLKFLGSVES